MQRAGLFLLTILVHLVGVLPFPLLYRLSDGMAFLFIHIFHYRRKVIRINLEKSFPEKSKDEINDLMQHFFRHFCDILLESIKGLTMTESEMKKRFVYHNPGIFDSLFQKGQSAILFGSHFGNWEWGVLSFPLAVQHTVVGIYKPLSNKAVDRYLNSLRTKWGLHLTSMTATGRAIVNYREQPCIFVLIADQTPSDVKNAHWMTFLNQDTPFLHGTEKIARQTGYPLFMFDVQRVRRGYYEVTFTEICKIPQAEKEGMVTARYASELEKIIRAKPSDWLWSHHRWKRKRPTV